MAHTSRRLHTAAALAMVAASALLAGCSGGSTISTSATTDPVTTVASDQGSLGPKTVVDAKATTVDAQDNLFSPANLQIKAGTVVTFDAVGHNQHDIVATDPTKLDFSVPATKFAANTKVSFTFSKPGTYAYYCSLHATATAGSMRGVITVTP